MKFKELLGMKKDIALWTAVELPKMGLAGSEKKYATCLHGVGFKINFM